MKGSFCKDLGFAKIDLHRKARRGFPEAVFCQGKTREQIKKISSEIIKSGGPLILTKLEKKDFALLKKALPNLQYNKKARIAYIKSRKRNILKKGLCLVISAGTSDIPVAEEACITLELMGNIVKRLYDVGVAGVHRLVNNYKLLREASVIIVVAGMEGALASLVSGLVPCPVIAVPTSCGYGANFKGLSALLTMLNSCSPGISVVNIDNGFGAGYFAGLVNR